jgi:hypothetical protein
VFGGCDGVDENGGESVKYNANKITRMITAKIAIPILTAAANVTI